MGQDDIAISAIIPCYNDAEFVVGAIESCLEQTIQPSEVIVVDDGSTDETETRINSFNDDVRYIWTENQGAAAARNTGVENAESEFIAFLDADDRWHEHKLEKQLDVIERDFAVDLIYTDYYLRNRSGDIIGRKRAIDDGPQFVNGIFVSGGALLPSSAAVRTEAFESVGGFDESLSTGHDRDLWIRLGMEGTVRRVPEPLVFRTTRTDSLASDYLSKFEDEKRSMKNLVSRYPELEALVGDRTAQMLCNRAAYQLSTGETSSARSDAFSSLRRNPLQLKPVLVAILSVLPEQFAAKSWHSLKFANRRIG